jgi:hypothetical protein
MVTPAGERAPSSKPFLFNQMQEKRAQSEKLSKKGRKERRIVKVGAI